MIRIAKKEDIKVIKNIGESFLSNFTKTYDIKSYLNDSKYLILIDKEEHINGFIIILKNIDCYEIELLIVEENERRKGIASKILRYFENNYLKQNDKILLEVSVLNNNALELYKKFGYEIINTRKKYYNGIDAYVMKKVI